MEQLSDIASEGPEGFRLVVRAKPGVKHPVPPRIVECGEGRRALEVSVSARAVDGRANASIEACLADFLGLKKADISILSGRGSRIKTVLVRGRAETLAKTLAGLL